VRQRFRILLWLDEAHNVEQIAVARYDGDDKTTESTWEPEPFDSAHDCLDAAMSALPRQLGLW